MDRASLFCSRCRAPFALGRRYAFPDGTGEECLRCALRHPSLVRRAASIALVVGTVLLLINQGDVVLSGLLPAALFWKVPLTYLVPYFVSTYSTLGAVAARTPAPLEGANALEALG